MLNQLFRPLILLMSADVYPRAIKRIADDLLAMRDELLNKVSGMEKGIFRNLSKSSFFDEIDACIGIVVVFGLFDKSFNVAAIKVENA